MISFKAIVIHLVEAFSMLYFGISLFNLTIDKKKIIFTAILYAFTVYSVRNIYEIFQIPLGTHSLVLLGLFTIYCAFICKLSIIQAIATAYASFTLTMLGEWMFTVPLLEKLDWEVEQGLYSTWKGIGVGLTAEVLLVGVAIIFYIKRTMEKDKNLSRGEISGIENN